MRVDTSAGSDRDARRRDRPLGRRPRRPLLTIALVVALGSTVVGCSATPDASSPSPESSTADDAPAAADDGALPIGSLDQRPVLAVLPPGVASGADVLADTSGMMSYSVGPQEGGRPAILSATAQQGPTGAWEVQPVLAPGADGIDLFNEQARRCHAQGPDCPSGQLAIVVDGRVVSAPRIQPDQTTFTPFSADAITISGGMTESEARALALALPAP